MAGRLRAQRLAAALQEKPWGARVRRRCPGGERPGEGTEEGTESPGAAARPQLAPCLGRQFGGGELPAVPWHRPRLALAALSSDCLAGEPVGGQQLGAQLVAGLRPQAVPWHPCSQEGQAGIALQPAHLQRTAGTAARLCRPLQRRLRPHQGRPGHRCQVSPVPPGGAMALAVVPIWRCPFCPPWHLSSSSEASPRAAQVPAVPASAVPCPGGRAGLGHRDASQQRWAAA